ncbi:MAG: site-2 protease family protein [Pyrodictiaceae archaeon]
MDPKLLILLSYVLAWMIIGGYCGLRCRKDEKARLVFNPLLFMLRLSRNLSWLDRIASFRWIIAYSTIGLGLLAYAAIEFYGISLRSLLQRILEPSKATAPFAPLVPGITISVETFFYLLPGLSIAIIVHELSHALAAKAEKLPINSVGLVVFLALIPGAFVEISEEALRSTRLISRLRVYSAGVAANLILALAILVLALNPLMASGVYAAIIDVEPNSTAERAGIIPGSLILGINGSAIHGINDVTRILGNVSKRTTFIITLYRDGEHYSVTVTKEPNKKIGILIVDVPKALTDVVDPITAYIIHQVLLLTFMINYALAVINAAPLFITDGAKALDSLLEAKWGKKGKEASRAIQLLTLFLLLLNINISRPLG